MQLDAPLSPCLFLPHRGGSKSYHQSWHLNCPDLNSTPSLAVLKRYTRDWSSHKLFAWTGELCTDGTIIDAQSFQFHVFQHGKWSLWITLKAAAINSTQFTMNVERKKNPSCYKSTEMFLSVFHTWGFPVLSVNRYLHKNRIQTHERRGEVKKLKEQLAALQQKLEWFVACLSWEITFKILWRQISFKLCPAFTHSYKNYGSGPAKYPLADMLQFVLEFATTKPTSVSPAEDLRPTSSSPTPPSQPLSEAISTDIRLSHRL